MAKTQEPQEPQEPQEEPKPVHPLLKAYDDEIYAVTLKHRKAHPDWFFGYKRAYIVPLNPQKRDSIHHTTEIHRA